MSTKCNYFIRITKCGLDPTIEPKCEGDCENCSCKGLPAALADGEKYPTIEEVRGAYLHTVPKQTSAQTVLRGLSVVMRMLGLSMTDEFRMLANQKAIEKFYSDATGMMSEATAIMRVNAVRSLCSVKVRELCKAHGLRVDEVHFAGIPNKVRGGMYNRLPDEVNLQLVSLYDDLRVNDPALWLVMEGAWNEGKRMTDIMHTRWDDFIVDGTKVTDVYVPHKTKDSSRETVRFPIDPITWMRLCKIRDLVRDFDGYWFKGHGAETAIDWPLGKRFNSVLRERVPYFKNTTKAAHELRKARSQSLIDLYGIEETAKLLGDNPQTLRRFYYDKHHVAFVPQGVGV